MQLASSLFLATILAAASVAPAALIVDSNFDGSQTKTNAGGGAWYSRSANATTAVTNDSAGIGTANAVKMTVNTNPTVWDRPLLGVFPTFTPAVGQSMTLSFDFRFGATPTTDVADGFRFGLYNANGTVVSADASASSDNDFGYQLSVGTRSSGGSAAGLVFKKETVNTVAGETGSGTDRTDLTTSATGATSAFIGDNLKHSAVFTLTRTASGIDFSGSLDGIASGTASDTSSVYTSFNEIVFAYHNPQDLYVDNVQLTPEPASLAFFALAGGGVLLSRRSRRGRGDRH